MISLEASSSREAAEIACGVEQVQHYERVKTFYTRFGLALEVQFASAVGGRCGNKSYGEPDVMTRLGSWQFATQANTKNSANGKHDLESVETGHCVQVFGIPRGGWISAREFLRLHDVANPDDVAQTCVTRAVAAAKDGGEQLVMAESRVVDCTACGTPITVYELPVRFIDPDLFRCIPCMDDRHSQLALEPPAREPETRRYDPAMSEIPI